MNRNNQRGAVGTFVVVGAVLAAAALAVLYGARHSLSDQQNPPISSELVAADNKSDNKNNKSNKDTKGGKDAKTENKSGGNSEQKTETGKNQDTDSKSGSDNSTIISGSEISGSDTKTESKSEDKKADTQTVPQTPAAQTNDKDLPKTGPAESLAAILAVGGLTFIVLAYVQSRRVV